MKRIVFLLLLGAFAATHLASAEDEKNENKQNPRRNTAAARPGPRHGENVQRGVQSFRVQPNMQQTARFNQGVRNRRYIEPVDARTLLSRSHNLNPQLHVTTNTTAGDVALANRFSRGGQNWQNNANTNFENNRNPNWRGHRNGNGNTNGNWRGNGNWADNHNNWDRQRRDRNWWRSHYTRFSYFGGGCYYWNSGYWYPAYGYDPYFTTYTYDAPIYAYQDQDPGQVIASVQAALQRRGYNAGGVDGTYGPATRNALINYQEDNGLEPTGEIDEATLDSLGLR